MCTDKNFPNADNGETPPSKEKLSKETPSAPPRREDSGRGDGFKFPDALAIVVILFPGFLAERVAEYFSTAPKLEDLELVATALGWTLVIFAFTWVVTRPFHRYLRWQGLTLQRLAVRPSFIVLLALISVAAGCTWAVVDSKGYLFGWRLTERVSRLDVWDQAFAKNARRDPPWYVRVTTESGNTYHGYPTFFSQGTEERSLLLSFARKEVHQRLDDHQEQGTNALAGSKRRECVFVGTDTHSEVLLSKNQIKIIEFRPAVFGTKKNEYSCEEWQPAAASTN